MTDTRSELEPDLAEPSKYPNRIAKPGPEGKLIVY
jgi:hypothetical protein